MGHINLLENIRLLSKEEVKVDGRTGYLRKFYGYDRINAAYYTVFELSWKQGLTARYIQTDYGCLGKEEDHKTELVKIAESMR